MPEGPYELVPTAEGIVARVHARGSAVLASPTINRGTAFTVEQRRELELIGLLPTGVTTLDGQLRRVYAQYREQANDLRRWVYLANLRDRNEVLFYRLLSEHIAEMLPVVYTPTVGLAIERFSHEFRRSRGAVYLSVDHPEDVETALRNSGMGAEDVDLLVATDSEGILGIGDQGVGGIEISVGKLAVYTAAAGIHPHRVIPVVLDVGTDNLKLLTDDLYLGARHARVRDQRYDDLIDAYVTAVTRLFPQAMLHWEDFGTSNARRILDRYADQVCTFNDDIQGTAAVVLAAAFSAVGATGTRLRDQRVVIHGAGTAGLGIADMMRDQMVREGLAHEEATRRFWALDRSGLLTDDRVGKLYDFQLPYARPAAEVAGWASAGSDVIGLADVVARARPTMLIGTSTQTGAFTEAIVRGMAEQVDRPIIMPLSNPTANCEAIPEDLIRWTDGRALIATGSPFPPVVHDDRPYRIAQANNALVFPGLGLGVTVARASRITAGMIAAAADAVAQLSDATTLGAPLLPPVDDLRRVSAAVGVAVAVAAVEEGLAQVPVTDPIQQVHQAMWRPEYPRIEVKPSL
ncbi:MAG TPA: NAD-dependent malic enzyme [Pseudonocardia sp.]|uniref:NAD-dependent malic enzyme n=1 Tax=Pseudonocardia sp. TaxID=60912 RepID=UPI002BC9099F|nr:NAD-dependent malic enzyme [Pseudonocardia sp.]HTF52645.1 NAD-dependent malic enzyme [Pseudonocardia sp.]